MRNRYDGAIANWISVIPQFSLIIAPYVSTKRDPLAKFIRARVCPGRARLLARDNLFARKKLPGSAGCYLPRQLCLSPELHFAAQNRQHIRTFRVLYNARRCCDTICKYIAHVTPRDLRGIKTFTGNVGVIIGLLCIYIYIC